MIAGKRIAVVLPAYNAAKTLRQTYSEIPHDIVDDIILTDDASSDNTAQIRRNSASTPFATIATVAMAAIRRPVTSRPWRAAPISW